MSRVVALRFCCRLAGLMITATCMFAPQAAAGELRPNFLIILADDK